VRGLALIAACEAHPLIVPRVRNYLASEFNLDEPSRLNWIRHWIVEANGALETHLREPETGRYCQGDQITLADICVVSHVVGAQLFEVDLARWPKLRQITEDCLALDAFGKAHPLRQPGAPAHGHH